MLLPSVCRLKYLPFSQTMTGGSEYQTCMIKAPPPPFLLLLLRSKSSCMYGFNPPATPPPHSHKHTNWTCIRPWAASAWASVHVSSAGSFPQQIPLVTFLLARCNKAFQDRCFPSPFQYRPSFSVTPLSLSCPLFALSLPPSLPLHLATHLSQGGKKNKKISYLHHHCQVST